MNEKVSIYDIVKHLNISPATVSYVINVVAIPTRAIKQADVIALLVLLGKEFNNEVLKSNFDFYYSYT